MNDRQQELERVAHNYHLDDAVPDKFIEDICQEHCCDWLRSLIAPDDCVIELGYGEGITLSRLYTAARQYTVVEGAPSLAKVVRARYPRIGLVESLFEDYLPVVPCDKVLALHVLEHVDDPVSLARHLRNWLLPDGEIIVVVPNRESLHRRLAVLMKLQPSLDTLSERDHLVGHQRVYDLASLEKDLEEAGFEPFERRGFFLKVLPNSMMLGYTQEMIEALNLLGDTLPVTHSANLAVRARVKS